MTYQDRTLRIIGGKWRGRKVTFRNTDDIRPTGDRIRETLFNWLMHDIAGAECLDLYSGSGALALEALSRGAKHVTLVEKDPGVSQHLSRLVASLANPSDYRIINSDALAFLFGCDRQFDLIFMDPPFADDELYKACQQVGDRNLARGYVYLESADKLDIDRLPAGWELRRVKQASAVHYGLCAPTFVP